MYMNFVYCVQFLFVCVCVCAMNLSTCCSIKFRYTAFIGQPSPIPAKHKTRQKRTTQEQRPPVYLCRFNKQKPAYAQLARPHKTVESRMCPCSLSVGCEPLCPCSLSVGCEPLCSCSLSVGCEPLCSCSLSAGCEPLFMLIVRGM